MRRKQINWGKRILSAALTAVMSLSLAISPLPGMMTDYEGEQVEAEGETTMPDAIYLPLTLRDARRDNLLFNAGTGVTLNGTGKVSEILDPVRKTPIYNNDAAITDLANRIVNRMSEETSGDAVKGIPNRDLKAALQGRMNSVGADNFKNATACSTQYLKGNGTFNTIQNKFDAANWMLSNLFYDTPLQASSGITLEKSQFMAKSSTYESLMLKRTETGSYKGKSEYYYYTSQNEKSIFDKTNKLIRNATSDTETGALTVTGKWFPLYPNSTSLTTDGLFNSYETEESASNPTLFNQLFSTTAGTGKFTYNKNQKLFFGFCGDDDVYLYINNKLVLDMGGLYSGTEAYVDLESPVTAKNKSNNGVAMEITDQGYYNAYTYTTNKTGINQTWAEYLGLEEGKTYDFHFFHMERQTSSSQFSIYTNINVVDPSLTPQKNAYLLNGTSEEPLVYGSYVPEDSTVMYEFTMTNNSPSQKEIKDLTFVDNMLGVSLNKNKLDVANTWGTALTNIKYAVYSIGQTPVYTTVSADGSNLKNALATGIPYGKTFSIKGFKYKVPNQSSIKNTVNVTAQGYATNSSTSKELIGSASTEIRVPSVNNATFIIDYAKPVNISNNQLYGIGNDNELTGFINSAIDGTEVSIGDVTIIGGTKDENDNSVKTGIYGTLSRNSTTNESNYLTYILNRFMDDTDSFVLDIPVTTTVIESSASSMVHLKKNVNFVPANNIYYEDSFVSESDASIGIVYSAGTWEIAKDSASTNTTADAVGNGSPVLNDNIHGWEDALSDDLKYSDGSAHKVTGKATAKFKFKGTGVDVYSRTDDETGTVLAILKHLDNNGEIIKRQSIIVDQLSESGTYYQIPTLSFNGLTYGEYEVEIRVTTAAGNRSTYYLDGIRIYNPSGTTNSSYPEKEQNATFTEVRDLLLDTSSDVFDSYKETQKNEEGKNVEVTVDGIVFIDEINGETGTTTTEIGTYREYGPKNEVYLAPGQGVVFKVSTANNYYIGLKAPKGVGTKAAVTNYVNRSEIAISTASDMYYEVTPYNVSNGKGLVLVKNTGSELLSITKLRTTNATAANSGIETASIEELTSYAATFNTRKVVPYGKVEEEKDDDVDVKVEIETPDTPSQQFNKLLQMLINRIFASFSKWL